MLPTTTVAPTTELAASQQVAQSATGLTYFPEMDALRTFAVGLTLVAHFFPAVGWMLVPYSWYGVDIFFSISGFLITLTLLRTRDADIPRGREVRHFFIRRFLRLFPIYYLFLLFFVFAWKFAHLQMWKPEYGPYFFGYAANYYFYQHTLGVAPGYSHLWSLSIEEQFYLLWPWLLLFIRGSQTLLFTIVAFILCGLVMHGLGDRLGDVRLLPFGNFHTLGAGALLAWLYHSHRQSALYRFLLRYKGWLTAISFSVLMLLLFYIEGKNSMLSVLRQLALMATTFFLVLLSVHGWTQPFQLCSRSKAVQYLGRISYGIYLFHLPLPILLSIFFSKVGLTIESPLLHLILLCSLTIVVAAISYRFIERPFLKMKRLFA